MSSAAPQPLVLPPVRRRDRPRLLTGLYLLMCMVVLFGAFASRNNLLYWFVGMAIGSVLVHGFVAGPPMMKILIGAVQLPDFVERASTSNVRVDVVSQNRWRIARAIRIEMALVSTAGLSLVARGGVAAIRPGETVRVSLPLAPAVRGVYHIKSIRMVTVFPFGLSRKELQFDVEGKLVVLPGAVELSGEEEQSLRTDAARQAAESQPADIREYVRGDPRRLIAWRASARAQRPMVRELEAERGRHVWLRIDLEAHELAPRKPAAEHVLDRALAVGRLASGMRYHIGIEHVQTGTRFLKPGGAAWETVLAELGDREGTVVGPKRSVGDLVIDLAPQPRDAAKEHAGA